MKMANDAFEILLVEDDPTDVYLIEEAFRTSPKPVKINHAGDGEEGLSFLKKTGKFKKARRPDAIILDLNLPKMDGRELLEAIKGDKELRTIPVLVMTTSSAEEDVATSYGLGANCFITKPFSLKDHEKVMQAIQDFWFLVARLPGKSAGPRDRF